MPALPTIAALQKITLQSFRDPRGVLVPVDLAQVVPFPVARVFWVYDVPVGTSRGGHAHKICQQFLVCMTGSVTVQIFDGAAERSVPLAAGDALYVPPGIFAAEEYGSPDAVLLVFCDRPYEPADYLTDRAAFLAYRRG